ncbi:unnamed protein product [Dovyalis caffra]|uniref:non-specific serine/threonine protein kinase n=1 Tax=Dovyalis caffra TaxID=77055 RepID=A0AAV1SKH5_9ROSI|nr:unnamed protein product [Dovyalis caffra]
MEAGKLFLFFSLLMLQFSFCTSQDSIKTNQTIKDGDLLISKGNTFALGFFSPGSSSYRYLGIWFHRVPGKTVVWVANRNHPIIGSSGFLSINQYGNLVLFGNSDQEVPVWSTNVSMEVADDCVAELLDSGNLVLVQNGSKRVVWQSFDYPTNVLLPGMKIGLNLKTGFERSLTSWRSADDPGIGDVSARVNPNGSPQLFLYKGTKPSCRTPLWPWRGHGNRQRSLYNMSIVNDQDEKYCIYNIPDDSLVLIIMVEYSGIVKKLTWHESESSDGQWKEFRRNPQYRCDFYGWCGPNSICQPTDVNRFECACLPGFEPKYPRDWFLRDGSGGCVRKLLESSSVCEHGEGFVKVENLILPDTSAAVWVDMSMSRADCELECKTNCSCSAYASIEIPGQGDGCLTWYGELLDLKYDLTENYDLFVRVDAHELGTVFLLSDKSNRIILC